MILGKFNKFKKDFLKFLDCSSVNLGRKTALTRQIFLDKASAMFETFRSNLTDDNKSDGVIDGKPLPNTMKGSVTRIKPSNSNKGLSIGKGVHSMTSSESMRADEQLNRSPYGAKSKQEGQKNG